MKHRLRMLLMPLLLALFIPLLGCGAIIDTGDIDSTDEAYAGEETDEPLVIEEPAEDVEEPTVIEDVAEEIQEPESDEAVEYRFRNSKYLNQHYEKHGIEMGFDSPESYEAAASAVVNNPDALHKIEAEDGDDVYYVEDTNEFVVVSTDGYIRTYFLPGGGKAYFDRQ